MSDWHPATIVTLVIGGAFGLAALAVILSKNANLAGSQGVLASGAGALSTIIGAAVAPVSGQMTSVGGSQLTTTAPQ